MNPPLRLELWLEAGSEGLQGKTTEPRGLVRRVATLQTLPLGNSSLRIRAYVMDISRRGLGIQSPLDLPKGTLVQVRLAPTNVVTGEIRYTVPRWDGYYSRVRVQGITDSRCDDYKDSVSPPPDLTH